MGINSSSTMILYILLAIYSIPHIPWSQAQTMDASGVIDQIVIAGRNGLKQKHQETMPVPDMEDTFKKGILKGGVKATGGVFSDLSTVERNGPATLTIHGASATVHVGLSLTVMKVAFSHSRGWLGALSSSDPVTVTVGDNRIDAQVTVTLGGACKSTLDFLHLTDFKNIKVDFKGAGKVLDPLTNALVNHFHNKVAAAVEAKLSGMLRDELNKNALCSLVNKG